VQRPRPSGKDSAVRLPSPTSTSLVDVIVLTEDAALLDSLQEAAGPNHQFFAAASSATAVDLLLGGHCGILVIDVSVVPGNVVELIDKLQSQFPELVLLATGRRQEQNAVAGLVAKGLVYRFLHKPVSPARAELFLSAATRRYGELYPHNQRTKFAAHGLSTIRKLAIAASAAAVIASAVAGWLWLDAERSTPPSTPIVAAQPPVGAEPDAVLARTDRVPATSEALPIRAKTLDVPRRTTPAPNAPASSTSPVRAPKSTTSSRALHPNVDTAKAFLAANQWLDPPDASALGALRAARAAGESATAIQIAATDLGTRLLNHSLAALARNDIRGAKHAVERASAIDREFDTALPDIEHVAQRIRDAEIAAQRAAHSALLEKASRLRVSGQLIEPPGDNAVEALAAALAADASSEEAKNEQQRLSFGLLESTRTALAAGDIDRADILATRAEEVLAGLPQTRALREQIGAARSHREAATAVLQAASLPRRREVPAVYPRAALSNGTEGWVDLEFMISPDGVPSEIRVKASEPLSVFDVAAIQALQQWRFQPLSSDGTPSARAATLRMQFRLRAG
jgi:TonB family protein